MPILVLLATLLLGATPAAAALTLASEPQPVADTFVCPTKPRVFQLALYHANDQAPRDITRYGKSVDAGVVRFYPPPIVIDAFLQPIATAIETAGLRSTMVAR